LIRLFRGQMLVLNRVRHPQRNSSNRVLGLGYVLLVHHCANGVSHIPDDGCR
jgi:hypothetical protein